MATFRFRESVTPRQKRLLALLVEHYIETAEPVGSKTLAAMMENSVSSATIRSELCALDEMGFLEQPHTSAGRIPTLPGYRFYIDNLMQERALTEAEREKIDSSLNIKSGSVEEMISKSCDALSSITGHAAVATAPIAETYLRRIEIFPMTARGVVVAIMTSSGLIKSRMATLGADVTSGNVYAFLQIVNSHLDGKYLGDITSFDFSVIAQAEGSLSFLFAPVMDAVSELIDESRESEMYVSGERHLLGAEKIEESLELIKFLSSKDALMALLHIPRGGTRVVMGSETDAPQLENISFVVSEYRGRMQSSGMIGLIVRANADYPKLIPTVDYFAGAVSRRIESYFSR